MKKLFLTIAVAIFTTSSMMAQNDSIASNEDTHVFNDLVSLTTSVDEEGGITKTWNLNFLKLTSEDTYTNNNKTAHGWVEVGLDYAYLGFSSLANSNVGLKPANSIECGLSLASINTWNRHNTFGVSTNFILSATNYKLQDDNVFHLDNDGNTVCEPIDKSELDYKKPRLVYMSWRMPVMLNWKFRDSHTHFSVGAEAELRHHVRSLAKVGHKKRYDVCRQDMGINPWGCNIIASYGYKDVSIVGRYSLTKFFDGEKANFDGTPFMIGVAFNL